MAKKKGFMVYHDHLHTLLELMEEGVLTAEDFVEIFRALLKFSEGDDPQIVKGDRLAVPFSFMSGLIERDNARYAQACINRGNGGRAKAANRAKKEGE